MVAPAALPAHNGIPVPQGRAAWPKAGGSTTFGSRASSFRSSRRRRLPLMTATGRASAGPTATGVSEAILPRPLHPEGLRLEDRAPRHRPLVAGRLGRPRLRHHDGRGSRPAVARVRERGRRDHPLAARRRVQAVQEARGEQRSRRRRRPSTTSTFTCSGPRRSSSRSSRWGTTARKPGGPNLGPYKTQHGGGGSPIVHDGLVIVNVDHDKPGSFVAALDRDTGDVRWRTPRASKNFSTSTPCVYRDAGRPRAAHLHHAGERLHRARPRDRPAALGTARHVRGPRRQLARGRGGSPDRRLRRRRPRQGRRRGEAAGRRRRQARASQYTLTDEVPYVPTPLAYRGRLFTWSDGGVGHLPRRRHRRAASGSAA